MRRLAFPAMSSLISPGGHISRRLKDVRSIVWVGFFIQLTTYALYAIFLTPSVPVWLQELLIICCAFGIGLSAPITMLIIQAWVSDDDMAAATSAWVLVRSMGPTIGVAVFTALLNTQLRTKFERIPGYGDKFEVPKGEKGYRAIHRLPDGEMKYAVLQAFSDSFKVRHQPARSRCDDVRVAPDERVFPANGSSRMRGVVADLKCRSAGLWGSAC